MTVASVCRRFIAGVYAKRLVLTTNGPVQDAQCFINMSQSVQSPDAPKRPLHPFVKFMKEKYSEVQKNKPGARVGEVAKIVSQLWHELGQEDQNARKLQAQEEYQDYKQKYLVFLDGLSEEEKSQLRAKKAYRKKLKDKQELYSLGRPKKPLNAYFMFMRSQHERLHYKDLANHWYIIPPSEKKIHKEGARVEKEKYDKELAEWEERMIEIGREDVIRTSSRIKFKRASKILK
ncbi:transcription factor A, mitochondrial-like isoform X2 [Pomacea canaliculata]|uniref:transcription factor A, mitochondrial-like isoform X2 n=1 Tax=Pomacea canaliculata TaxID=400727 RepID=UPI000D73200C|nr:transcription factor A, mitochondrial-like isoform X2 [Pomacea canaliculata]